MAIAFGISLNIIFAAGLCFVAWRLRTFSFKAPKVPVNTNIDSEPRAILEEVGDDLFLTEADGTRRRYGDHGWELCKEEAA